MSSPLQRRQRVKGATRSVSAKRRQDFTCLSFGKLRTRIVTCSHRSVHEQTAIAREQSTIFSNSQRDQFRVGSERRISDVNA